MTPSFGAWLAKLAVTGTFLAAYGIPVTFHTIMAVIGGNSLANTVSATPGGVGVNQAINAASGRSRSQSRKQTDAAAVLQTVGARRRITTPASAPSISVGTTVRKR